jgi:hypothetical protein
MVAPTLGATFVSYPVKLIEKKELTMPRGGGGDSGGDSGGGDSSPPPASPKTASQKRGKRNKGSGPRKKVRRKPKKAREELAIKKRY